MDRSRYFYANLLTGDCEDEIGALPGGRLNRAGREAVQLRKPPQECIQVCAFVCLLGIHEV